ncbi:MAG: tyrosine-type recombinase/integrase [Patescibacteria group bacterium]
MTQKEKNKASLVELFETFVKQRRSSEGKATATIRNYHDSFELLLKFKPDVRLSDLNSDLMVDFFDFAQTRERMVGNKLVVRPLKNSSIATIRGKLSSFFMWLVENKYLAKNPFKGIAWPDVSYTDKRAFTKEEFDKIYVAISRDIVWENKLLKKRNLAMIMFFNLTGVRKGEFLGLNLSDVNLREKVVTVRGETSKSKRTRNIPLKLELLPFLEEYLDCRRDYSTEAFWVSSTKDCRYTAHGLKHTINHLNEVTGINCHVHRFRHTFAVNYYMQTNDLVGLYGLLGHRSFKMTLSYLRSLSDDHIIKQMDALKLAKFR